MPLKVNEFNIKAHILEDEMNTDSQEMDAHDSNLSESVKQEIIDECVERMKELLAREKSRY